jgi:hypothetical protein
MLCALAHFRVATICHYRWKSLTQPQTFQRSYFQYFAASVLVSLILAAIFVPLGGWKPSKMGFIWYALHISNSGNFIN